MSLEILKMLIQSACSEGEVLEDDKILLSKKAEELGISESELQKMIDARLKGDSYEPVISDTGKNTAIPPDLKTEEPVIPNVLKQSVKKEQIEDLSKKTDLPPIPEIVEKTTTSIPEIKKEEIIIPEALKEKKKEVIIKEEEPQIKPEIPPVPENKNTQISKPEMKNEQNIQAQKSQETKAPEAGGSKKIIPLVILGVVVVVLVLGFVFKDKIFGTRENKEQTNNEQVTNGNSEDLYKKFMEQGKTAFAGSEYLKAKNSFDSALVYKKGDTDASTWSSKLQTIISLLNEANDLFKNKNIARAKLRYDSLLKIAPDEKTAAANLPVCKDIIAKAKDLKAKKSESDAKFGYEDASGNIVIDFVFVNAKDFFGKLAAVQNSANKWGLIGEDYPQTGKTVVDFKFDDVKKQSPGYSCRINGDDHYYAFFLKNGQLVEKKY